MHNLDLIFLAAAFICFYAAYYVSSRPARQKKAIQMERNAWKEEHVEQRSISAEAFNMVHEETH
jgi:hypothetical protein